MSRLSMAAICLATLTGLTACGGSDSTGGSSGAGDDTSWHINNKQTRYQDVYFTDDEISAGLEMMEQDIVIPGGDRNGRDTSQAKCWMVLDSDGMLRQFMWCGPLVNGDGLDEWSPYPFGSEADGDDGQVIIHAPMLRDDIGRLTADDTLRRPDGAKVPDSGKPGAAPQTAERPSAGECGIDGTVTHNAVTLDLAEADYLDIQTSVKENELVSAGSATQYIVTHVIRFWDDQADAGHVLTLSSSGEVDGPWEPRSLSLNPYLQTREQMESGASASQSLSASPSDGGTFDMRGAEGATVIATATRETFSGEETADIDVTLNCD